MLTRNNYGKTLHDQLQLQLSPRIPSGIRPNIHTGLHP